MLIIMGHNSDVIWALKWHLFIDGVKHSSFEISGSYYWNIPLQQNVHLLKVSNAVIITIIMVDLHSGQTTEICKK